MQEPKIKSLARPLSWDDREDLGEIEFSEYNYVIGVETQAYGPKDGLIPKEVGQFVAYIIDVDEDLGTFTTEPVELNSCKEFLTQRTIDASTPKVAQLIESGNLQCLNPGQSVISSYTDGIGKGSKILVFRFNKCFEIDKHDKSCLPWMEADKWFQKNDVYVNYFETKNLIDFTSLENYELSSMDYMKIRDRLEFG